MTAEAPQIEDVLALSPLQEGLFSLAQMADDGIDLYTMQFIVDIGGPLDVALLRRSVEAILQRHPNLRVSFWDRDLPKPVQIVPTWAELPWSERSAAHEDFDAIAESERQLKFDLSSGPALRVVLVNLPNDRRRMILTAHHILMDGWAVAVFFGELIAVYNAGGETGSLPDPRPYRDYIGWLNAQDTAAATNDWAQYLGGLSGPLMLADGSADVGATVPQRTRLSLDAADTAALTQWARSNGFTLNTAVQFAWAVVLGRLTDRRDVVFGTTISGRPDALPGVETMIGLFINTIPSFVEFDRSQTVKQQCAQLQRESATMRDKGFLSLSTVQRAVGHGSLFDTLFVFENAPIGSATEPVTAADGARFLPVTMESLAHYPLTVVAYVLDGSLVVIMEAIPEAIPHYSAADIGVRLLAVLRQLPSSTDATADSLEVVSAAERAALVGAAEAFSQPSTIVELFEQQVAATPDALALTTTDDSFTYAELRDAAHRLAAEFVARGVGAEDVVALLLPRSARSIVAILAVLEAGAAYVPVDITLPSTRIESILRQSSPALVVAVDETLSLETGNIPVLNLDEPYGAAEFARPLVRASQLHPQQCAYLIFTSGSTGEPKGVMGTHEAVVSYFADHRDHVYAPAVARLGRKLTIAHAWSLSFDASWQPLIGLLDGHALHLFDADQMRDANRLVDGLVAHNVDMIDTSPSMFTQLAAAGLSETQLAVLALGGEAIGPQMWAQLQAMPETDVFNCYGPTETTVEAVVATVKKSPVPTVGGPTAGMSAYVLDSALRLVPTGVAGELYLSGAQLTRGYVGKPATTADRFVADPFRGGRRMYRTGDLVRRLPSGGLSFLGRTDTQVKVRGYRIEISEVESALLRLPSVDNAAVIVVRRASGASLVGFVVGDAIETGRLRSALAERLPGYMIPSRLIALDALPVTSNGKLDAHALTRIASSYAVAKAEPETDTERALCAAFAELLDATPGVDEDFFDLGMDSIVAISLVNKMRRLGLPITPRMVQATPTIRDLAAAIDSASVVSRTDAAEYGDIGAVPIIEWMYEYGNFRRFTQTALASLPSDIDSDRLESVLQAVLDGHDMLRSQLSETDDGYRLMSREPGAVRASDILTKVPAPDFEATLAESARSAIDRIDPLTGSMVQAVWFERPDTDDVLLLTIHHLATDAVSWHVLFADLAEAGSQVEAGNPKVMPEFTSYRRWAELLGERAKSAEVLAQQDYWAAQVAVPDPVIGDRLPDPTTDTWSSLQVTTAPTSVETTRVLLDKVTKEVGVREYLLTALTLTIAQWRAERGQDSTTGALIALEGHGREDDVLGTDSAPTDTAQTVGWFTSVYPVRLGAGSAVTVESVTAELSAIPNRGFDYGLLRYAVRAPELVDGPAPQIEFNYLGRFDLSGASEVASAWSPITDLALNGLLPLDPEPNLPLRYTLDVAAVVQPTAEGPQLVTTWRWSDKLFSAADADRLAEIWSQTIATVIS